MEANHSIELFVAEEETGLRLDVFLAGQVEDASRSFIKKLIKDGRVLVNGQTCKRPSRSMNAADRATVRIPPPATTSLEPENIPLDIRYQDKDVLVVNKAPGMVVHPAPGHETGTLVHAVLYHCPDFQRSGPEPDRPGIVHRLDRDTSGIMVVAKNPAALTHLAGQAHAHAFDRRYLAIVRGEFPESTGRIDASIGRSLVDRKRMAVTGVHGRDAVTHFTVLERFGLASLVTLQLETGRTHQIRVHLRFAGHPVLGDPVYGVTDFHKWQIPDALRASLSKLTGQALHAEHLGFTHPATKQRMTFTSAPPPDFQAVLDNLRALPPC